MATAPNAPTTQYLPNRHEALKHLKLLDCFGDHFTFQTLDDNKDRADPSLTSILHGRLEDVWSALVRANIKGAGIFVTANRTDLAGRKMANMQSSRSSFGEFDQQPLKQFPLAPSFSVQTSPGRGHCYWLCDDLTPEEHRAIQ